MPKVKTGRIVLMSVAVILLGSGMAVGQCCIVPSSETTQAIGEAPLFDYPKALFAQTITTSTSVVGHTIIEFTSAQGTNSCIWPSSGLSDHPGVSGGSWFVGTDSRWGPDAVGWRKAQIDLIRQDGTRAGLILTETRGCSFIIYQGLEIECDPGTNLFFAYVTNNRITETLYSDHLAACREENISPFNKACDNPIPY